VNLDAAYGWDNEGRLASLTPPGAGAKQYVNSYDAMGRLTSMTEAGTTVATASYGPVGR
jgi:hypothetical protein